MADHISDTLPRLADALGEVGTRLGQISAELHALTTTPAPADRTMEAAAPSSREPGPSDTVPTPAEGTANPVGTDHPTPTPPSGLPTAPRPAEPGATQSPQRPGVPPASGAPTRTPPSGPTAGIPHPAATPAGSPHPGVFPPPLGQVPPFGAQQAASTMGQPPRWTHQTVPGWQPPPPWVGPPTPPPPPGPTLWERLSRDGAGSRILAWAGGVVTLAGVVLLLILAIQRGYLGPLPRVLLGAGLGLVLTGIGAVLHRNPTARTGAYALAATGIAVLYLAVVASTTLYGYLPPWGGLVTGLVVTAGGIALAGLWNSELLAIFVVVCCAVSSPVITKGFDGLLLAFLLVLLLGTTPVQLAKRWRGLLLAAGLPPVVVCLVNLGVHEHDVTTAIMAGVTSAIVILLATATALRRPEDEFTLIVLVLAAIPGLLAALQLPRLGASILPAAVGVLLLGVWLVGYVADLPKPFALTAAGLASLAFLQATATAFDGDARAIAFLAEALILTAVAVRVRLAPALLPAGLFAVIGYILGLGFAARPELLVRPRFGGTDVGVAVSLGVTGLLFAGVAITFCWAVFRLGVIPNGAHAPHGWVPAGVLALYGSTAMFVSIGLLISPDRDGFLLGHVFVTVSWTVAALVLLLRGIDSVPLRVAGLSLVVAALAKLVLFDLSSLDGMARVAAFLVAGLVLLAAGARYAKLVATRARP